MASPITSGRTAVREAEVSRKISEARKLFGDVFGLNAILRDPLEQCKELKNFVYLCKVAECIATKVNKQFKPGVGPAGQMDVHKNYDRFATVCREQLHFSENELVTLADLERDRTNKLANCLDALSQKYYEAVGTRQRRAQEMATPGRRTAAGMGQTAPRRMVTRGLAAAAKGASTQRSLFQGDSDDEVQLRGRRKGPDTCREDAEDDIDTDDGDVAADTLMSPASAMAAASGLPVGPPTHTAAVPPATARKAPRPAAAAAAAPTSTGMGSRIAQAAQAIWSPRRNAADTAAAATQQQLQQQREALRRAASRAEAQAKQYEEELKQLRQREAATTTERGQWEAQRRRIQAEKARIEQAAAEARRAGEAERLRLTEAITELQARSDAQQRGLEQESQRAEKAEQAAEAAEAAQATAEREAARMRQELQLVQTELETQGDEARGKQQEQARAFSELKHKADQSIRRAATIIDKCRAAHQSLGVAASGMRALRADLQQEFADTSSVLGSLGARLVGGVRKAQQAAAEADRRFVRENRERRRAFNALQEVKGNIRVFARVRPVLPKEQAKAAAAVVATTSEYELRVSGGAKPKGFEFDQVFGPASKQQDVFDEISPLVLSAIDGYHVCIFAYGQTGSGKTFTMSGSPTDHGVYQRTLEQLFREANDRCDSHRIDVQVSMVEIYNERVRDLLHARAGSGASSQAAAAAAGGGDPADLELRQGPTGVYMPGVTKVAVTAAPEVEAVMRQGEDSRSVGRTDANAHSSRSHQLLLVDITATNKVTDVSTSGRLVLVDLAGSERVSKSGATGQRMKEAQNINKSLSALGDVIGALTHKQSHVPYRNSKLTYLLQDSLGKDNKALMIVQVSPVEDSRSETMCSLNFASRVRKVEQGKARVHAAVDPQEAQRAKQAAKEALAEVRRLRAALEKAEAAKADLTKKEQEARKAAGEAQRNARETARSENKQRAKQEETLRRALDDAKKSAEQYKAAAKAAKEAEATAKAEAAAQSQRAAEAEAASKAARGELKQAKLTAKEAQGQEAAEAAEATTALQQQLDEALERVDLAQQAARAAEARAEAAEEAAASARTEADEAEAKAAASATVQAADAEQAAEVAAVKAAAAEAAAVASERIAGLEARVEALQRQLEQQTQLHAVQLDEAAARTAVAAATSGEQHLDEVEEVGHEAEAGASRSRVATPGAKRRHRPAQRPAEAAADAEASPAKRGREAAAQAEAARREEDDDETTPVMEEDDGEEEEGGEADASMEQPTAGDHEEEGEEEEAGSDDDDEFRSASAVFGMAPTPMKRGAKARAANSAAKPLAARAHRPQPAATLAAEATSTGKPAGRARFAANPKEDTPEASAVPSYVRRHALGLSPAVSGILRRKQQAATTTPADPTDPAASAIAAAAAATSTTRAAAKKPASKARPAAAARRRGSASSTASRDAGPTAAARGTTRAARAARTGSAAAAASTGPDASTSAATGAATTRRATRSTRASNRQSTQALLGSILKSSARASVILSGSSSAHNRTRSGAAKPTRVSTRASASRTGTATTPTAGSENAGPTGGARRSSRSRWR